MTQDPVVTALTAALAAGDSLPLRMALGDHLARTSRHAEALAQYEAALLIDPSNSDVLAAAALMAGELGDTAKASTYRMLIDHQPARTTVRPISSPPPSPVSPSPPSALPPRAEIAHKGPRLVTSDGELLEIEDTPSITFKDVAGMVEVKERLNRSFLQALKNPELFRKYGKTVGGGLILYGPPGCGKTYLARALAGELQARFLNIGLSDVLDMWFGEAERKLHVLFENARRMAPVVVFFDEVDALGLKRSKMSGSVGRNLVNQFLAEMDGVQSRNEGLFFLGATNHPWDIDTALRRPGRFDRMLFVTPPDLEARHTLLQLSLEAKPVVPEIDLAPIARATEGFSGADMVAVVSEALELAISASLTSGREVPVDTKLLQQALRACRASTRPWFDTARNYAIYANEGGTFDDMLSYMKNHGIA